MDKYDREAIEGLFDKLARVERETPMRDAGAERFIAEAIQRQPGAPYYMAQSVIVQEHALNAAQSRIEELETELADARTSPQGGGFLSGLFGGGSAPRRPARGPQPMPQGGPPGGFLAGAGQTAMGVAGGMLLANAVAGMYRGEAEAAETPAEAESDLGDAGFEDDSEC